MGEVIIQSVTTKNPISLIGEEAGICWGADTSDGKINFRRGMMCLRSEHGRTWEFPEVCMILDGYSARVIREWYTHIGGSPTRLQASTRYINYQDGFEWIIPESIVNNDKAFDKYNAAMAQINLALCSLEKLGVPKEDSALLLPLGMKTKIVCKHNFRNLESMAGQRFCSRAYWEYRELMNDIKNALSEYSEEWKMLCDMYFIPKCEKVGYCTEVHSCGRKPKREAVLNG